MGHEGGQPHDFRCRRTVWPPGGVSLAQHLRVGHGEDEDLADEDIVLEAPILEGDMEELGQRVAEAVVREPFPMGHPP